MKQKRWTKKCSHIYPQIINFKSWFVEPKKCGHYIPDEYEICDNCLLRKYSLWPSGPDCLVMYGKFYREEDVLEALRKAEKHENI